jgi:hypothetical protein
MATLRFSINFDGKVYPRGTDVRVLDMNQHWPPVKKDSPFIWVKFPNDVETVLDKNQILVGQDVSKQA